MLYHPYILISRDISEHLSDGEFTLGQGEYMALCGSGLSISVLADADNRYTEPDEGNNLLLVEGFGVSGSLDGRDVCKG